MDANVLNQKQLDLLHEIENNQDNFLAARVFRLFERVIRKVTRNHRPLSSLYLSAFILLFSLVPSFILVLLLKEGASFKVIGFDWVIGVLETTSGVIAVYYTGNFILGYIKDHLLGIQEINDLEDLNRYLEKLWNPTHLYRRTLLPAVIWGIIASFMLSYLFGAFAGFSMIAATLMFGLGIAIAFDYLLWIVRLPNHFGQYHFILNNVDPSSSEIVERISNLFNKLLYIHAIFFTIVTLTITVLGREAYVATPLVLAFWVILTAQFVNTQSALKNIISTAKWNTLNEIQAEIRTLQLPGNLIKKETTDAINRLMDLHDRVMKTPDSRMNVRTILNFINQLLLPLAGVVLSYFDQILGFLGL